jgi:acyl carrier protein
VAAASHQLHLGVRLDIRADVLAVLDDVLSLKGRARNFRDETALLGSLPELDSMAVASVLASLEERFGFAIDDDEIDGSTFETVGRLVAFVDGKLRATH